jgi:ribosomal protein S18 acetylase RimI-like enzyme
MSWRFIRFRRASIAMFDMGCARSMIDGKTYRVSSSFCAFTISTARGGFVILMEDVVIHPRHRGQGYGTMLVDHVIEFAKQKRFLRITLLTDKISAESQEFFRKQGFEFSNMIPMRRLIE